MTRVAVAAQHRLRKAIVESLRARDEVTELPEDPTADALASLPISPDVVVFGWERLGAEQDAAIRLVRAAIPAAAVVAVVANLTPAAVTAAVEAGLSGLVRTGEMEGCLPLAVEAAQRGQILVPRDAWTVQLAPALSVREKQALALVVMGFSNAEIAKKLYVTESTVKSHLSSAFSRLGVRTRREATALILDPDRGFGTGILTISDADRKQRRSPPAAD